MKWWSSKIGQTGDSLRATAGFLVRLPMRRMVDRNNGDRAGRGRPAPLWTPSHESALPNPPKSTPVPQESGHPYPRIGGLHHGMSGEGSRAQAVRKRIEGASPVDQHRVLGGENSGRAARGDPIGRGSKAGCTGSPRWPPSMENWRLIERRKRRRCTWTIWPLWICSRRMVLSISCSTDTSRLKYTLI